MQFRNPKFGNTFTIDNNQVIHRTLGGTLNVISSTNWPTIQSFSVQYEALSKAMIDDFIAFYLDSIGEEIEYTDHEGRIWNGMITTPNLLISQSGDDCRYETSFSFEGEIVGQV